MHQLKLTPGKLAFVVATRAALAAGIGLLLSSKLSPRTRRPIGIGLVALGAITTFPAVRTLAHAAH
jgi:hypothetical protein